MLGSNFTLSLDMSESTQSKTIALTSNREVDVLEGPAMDLHAIPEKSATFPCSVDAMLDESPARSSSIQWVPYEDPLESAVLQELLPKVLPDDFAISDIRRILVAAGIEDRRDLQPPPPSLNTSTSGAVPDEGSHNAYTASLTALSLRVEDLLAQRGSISEPVLRRNMYRLKEALAEILMDQCRV